MADFIPSKKSAQDFNNGVQYEGYNPTTQELGDAVQAETINNLVESALYSQNQADSAQQAAAGALSQVNQVIEDKTLLPDVQKNYYNLGAFDTFVSNGDRTGTIARKTGYLDITSEMNWGFYNGVAYVETYRPLYLNSVANRTELDGHLIEFGNADNQTVLHIQNVQSINEAKQLIDNYPLYIEYRLALQNQYTEIVIDNQPINTFNQKEESFFNNEWEKTLNLFYTSNYVGSEFGASFTVLNDNKLQVNKGSQVYSRVKFNAKFVEGTNYYFSATTDNPTRVVIADVTNNTENIISDINNQTVFNFSFVAGENTLIYLYSTSANETTYSNIMLNKGSYPYPYENYYGSILHEKDLSGVQLFPENVNPAQTIGGDWEDLGTISTSNSTTLHAYRRL